MNRFLTAALVLFFAAGTTSAQVTITRIADTSSIGPDGQFAAFGNYPVIDGSTVAFWSDASAFFPTFYGKTGSSFSRLVPILTQIPGGTGIFDGPSTLFGCRSGVTIFTAFSSSRDAVMTSSGGPATILVESTVGDQSGFTSIGSALSDGSAFTFRGIANNVSGIYFGGGLIANTATAVPGGSGNFTTLGPTPAVSGSNVVFEGSSGGGASSGIYFRDSTNTLSVVADTNTILPNGPIRFPNSFGQPTVSGANVAFTNAGSLYARIGGVLKAIADPSTPSPNGTGNFTAINGFAPINGNEIGFVGDTATSEGIYLYDGSALHVLLDNTNPSLDGQTLSSTSPFALGPGALEGNDVAFAVYFAGNNGLPGAIYEATFTPVPEPSTLALVGFAALALLRRRVLVRRSPA